MNDADFTISPKHILSRYRMNAMATLTAITANRTRVGRWFGLLSACIAGLQALEIVHGIIGADSWMHRWPRLLRGPDRLQRNRVA